MTVTLPEPDMSYVIDGPAKYNAQQMYAYAAAVSAADNAALRKALTHISLCSQTSMSSKDECGRIARAALREAT